MTQVNRRSAAAATFIGQGATAVINLGQVFLLAPLCLSYLGPYHYSSWLVVSELLVWIQLLDGGLPNLLTQRVAALLGRGERAEAARWISTTLLWLAAGGVGVLVVSLLAVPVVSRWLVEGEEHRTTFAGAISVAVLASTLIMVTNGIVGLSRGTQRTAFLGTVQVVSAVVALLVPAGLLLAGWGVWALVVGTLARAGVMVAGAIAFLAQMTARGEPWRARPSRRISGEIAGLVPSMSAGNIGYALGNNSELLLVSSLLGPLPALAYALTRRAFDGARSLVDGIAFAIGGGFAHLVSADDRGRAREVLGEILWLRGTVAALILGAAVVMNEHVVSLLFDAANFGGLLLTFAFAAQTLCAGHSLLVNFLWRAAGHVREGSLFLAVEAIVKVGLMALGLVVMGPIGAPVAGCVASLMALFLILRRLNATLPPRLTKTQTVGAVGRLAPGVIFLSAVGLACLPLPVSWITAGSLAVVHVLMGAGVFWWTQPPMARARLTRFARFSA
jgi:O-antigen/teichoic acid export membrane protein